MIRILAFLAGCMFISSSIFAQLGDVPQDWFHLDMQKDGFPGISTNKTYEQLIGDQQGDTVIVAVIDSGVDIEHEDLNDVIWVNTGEIPNNGKDDDQNGYVDDVHGWNFIGGKNGDNVHYDNLEMTRIYAQLKKKFKGKKEADISKKDKDDYDKFVEYGNVIERELEKVQPEIENFGMTLQLLNMLELNINKEEVTLEDIKNHNYSDEMLGRAAQAIYQMVSQSGMDYKTYKKSFKEYYDYLSSKKYHYDPELNSRDIVQDNYANVDERSYGNNDVEGPDATHGTHVAGIIAGERNNNAGMNGVADRVQIMVIRTVPDGDERDKDVANAIRYAVDNGASIVNMSFGKGASPRKKAVDDAVKYAMKNDVLLIHAAGNSGQENEFDNNYPNDKFAKPGLFGPRYAKNWIEVGASNWSLDENLPASFSNYSSEWVDIFAPGVDIYAPVLDDEYDFNQGTSMAAPVVAGVAALVRSRFPDLTAEQVKEVLLQSSVKEKLKVRKPGSSDQVSFSSLSTSGGLVNAYEAIRLAGTMKGKKKKKKNKQGKSNSQGNGKQNGKAKDVV